MVAELCELNRNMMMSVDIIPVPTDEAVRELENRLLGVETNITNWQRKQNQNNNFSAVIPYDLEQQRKESKEFLDDLTTRDQRMLFAVLTLSLIHISDEDFICGEAKINESCKDGAEDTDEEETNEDECCSDCPYFCPVCGECMCEDECNE